jgi:hypothetical protein
MLEDVRKDAELRARINAAHYESLAKQAFDEGKIALALQWTRQANQAKETLEVSRQLSQHKGD